MFERVEDDFSGVHSVLRQLGGDLEGSKVINVDNHPGKHQSSLERDIDMNVVIPSYICFTKPFYLLQSCRCSDVGLNYPQINACKIVHLI